MFFLDDELILSPKDLRQAADCEFALLRQFDVLTGRADVAVAEDDPMLERVAELGTLHEQAELRRLAAAHPGGIRTMPRPEHSMAGLRAGMAATVEALTAPGDQLQVLSQAVFFDCTFFGLADFVERTPQGWRISDTKLARSANVPALLQIAAYAAQLADLDVPVAPVARLVLGSGEVRDFALDEILPVHRRRRARLAEMLAIHRASSGPVQWGDERWVACGRCATCDDEVQRHRDLLLVAGMRTRVRRRLLEAGLTTIESLAGFESGVAEVSAARLAQLQAQARLQLVQDADPEGWVHHEIRREGEVALRRLPRPSAGDLFFDFEGDPLWAERGSADWGLEYLFGMVEVDSGADVFRALWAHDRAEEKAALEAFVAHVQARLRQWPDLHIYHYAPYEVSALTRLAARHSTCEDAIDQFLRAGIFVDLYAVVRASLRVSQRSYSIKKLEPLYMGARTAEVTKGDDSIVQYHLFQAARDAGDAERARELLAGIGDYNREDCISTRLLRDWLLDLVRVDAQGGTESDSSADNSSADNSSANSSAAGAMAALERAPSERRLAQLALEASVRELVDGIPVGERSAEDQAIAMVAAGVLYHAREDKPVWWRHYDRIKWPVDQWMRESGVGVVDTGEVGEGPTILTDWEKPPGKRVFRRSYTVIVDPIGGSPLGEGVVSALYAAPVDFAVGTDHDPLATHVKSPGTVTIVDCEEVLASNGRQHQRLTVVENAPGGVLVDHFPVAFVPTGPIGTGSLDQALDELASEVADRHPSLPARAGIDLLLRRPPRLRSLAGVDNAARPVALPAVGVGPDRFIDAVETALRDMDDSYVAVQGPPGTGKTYVGARVIARLVASGWSVGVCAQSHAAVENVLDAVIGAGVSPTQVGKVPKHSEGPGWTALKTPDDLAGFIAQQRDEGRGVVVGGTAWDLTNTRRVERGSLDLVVIDEAGQFSLAKTLAVSMAGARLLLLGDPAQLPQVSQGTHAEPIDESALGWLAAGAPVLPAELGYFLETTWRMHPRLTEVISRLAYAGQLRSQLSVTQARRLEGVEPGLHVRLVEHRDNSQWSREEADVVVDIVRDLLGRSWDDQGDASPEGPSGPRPLEQSDVIVITPYNAQVGTIRVALRDAGLGDVPVGTVDKFQGREAAVAIVSMAASAHGDVPRGIGFLLDRHRLNVAISRGKHAAYLVRSVALTDFGPNSASELLALGAFLGLCDQAVTTTVAATGHLAHRPTLDR